MFAQPVSLILLSAYPLKTLDLGASRGQSTGQQTIALGPNMVRCLFLCALQARNRFYILKLLEEEVKE